MTRRERERKLKSGSGIGFLGLVEAGRKEKERETAVLKDFSDLKSREGQILVASMEDHVWSK